MHYLVKRCVPTINFQGRPDKAIYLRFQLRFPSGLVRCILKFVEVFHNLKKSKCMINKRTESS